ncbi:amino acid adenylation domain-containing protein [Paenibacillus sp. CMAA1739]|uniref:amino acid adenylation domain-containing protein n=1 Tax=Paenibacillus ottowii TaxID=2315729 RepID=UPI0027301420|nr:MULTISPECIES: amino acid adenylation domain-containing protein [Paenibacillus]MDP1510652.1 amino acid adenylation domain-containing protein [Paenibacillus ottowii]MEC4566068.1 amino acid adenylation domain-containing protein [Paenibacillus sp. CMAA1739]
MRTNLLDYLKITSERVPDRTAVIDGGRSISFLDLTEDAKKLSSIINRKINGIIRKPVAVLLDKQIESVVADIAIIFCGNAYMNLDSKTPVQRISNIIELIEPELIITNHKFMPKLEGICPSEKILNLDELDLRNEAYSQEMLDHISGKIIDTDPLCIINTSGSTGVPKGVILNHRSFIDFTEWATHTTGISDGEVIGSLSPSVFDIYSFELCMLMALGSTILILPDGLSAFPARLLQLLQENKATYIFWVPTIMVNIANMDLLSRISLPSLKSIWFAGEVFPTKQFNYWRRHLKQARFINLYGPIEITLDCTYYIVDRELSDDEPIPIGVACKNTDVFILNEEDKLCGVNEEGELCVRGSSLAMGYYNNPEKTAAAFVQNPLNHSYPEIIYRTGDIALVNDRGEFIFKGRKDSIIKHSGYRIELGEIEHVIINILKLVENGCVVYSPDKKELTFYYESDQEITVADFRSHIGTVLPKYMIPHVYKRFEQLPRNTNGKIDRQKLKELMSSVEF